MSQNTNRIDPAIEKTVSPTHKRIGQTEEGLKKNSKMKIRAVRVKKTKGSKKIRLEKSTIEKEERKRKKKE